MNVTILKMQKLTPAKVDLVAKPLLIPASSLIILLLRIPMITWFSLLTRVKIRQRHDPKSVHKTSGGHNTSLNLHILMKFSRIALCVQLTER